MQNALADKSTHINSTCDGNNEMSIILFVSQFKEMLEDYNKTVLGAKEIVDSKENRESKGNKEA